MLNSLLKVFEINIFKNNFILLNIVMFFYFLILEIMIGFNNGSKAIIATLLIEGNFDKEIYIFGYLLQKFFNFSLSIFNFLQIGNSTLRVDHFIIHIIFYIAPVSWLILFNIIIKNKTSLNIIIFIFLFCNPVFVEFLHYAWRQAIALSLFLIIWSLNFKYINTVVLSITSVIVHFGMLPIMVLMGTLQIFNKKTYILLSIISLICISYIIGEIFPFSKALIPENFPYYERLTLSYDSDGFRNTPINNKEGDYILRYFIIGILPVFFILIKLVYRKLYFVENKMSYNLILAGSFPLVLFATIPTANRFAYFFIWIFLIYGPEILYKVLKLYKNPKTSYYSTLASLLMGHVIIYIYFIIYK